MQVSVSSASATRLLSREERDKYIIATLLSSRNLTTEIHRNTAALFFTNSYEFNS